MLPMPLEAYLSLFMSAISSGTMFSMDWCVKADGIGAFFLVELFKNAADCPDNIFRGG